MDISTKYTKLEAINWPVFRLGEKPPVHDNGLVFYYTHYVDDGNKETASIRIVDDKNLPQRNLGLRRLYLKSSGDTLFPIRAAIYFLADLIKLSKSSTWFIDSSGTVFQYEKTTRAKLTTKKIKKVLPATGLGCVFELEGIPNRFKAIRHPKEEEIYAKVLKLGMSFIFYGFCSSNEPDSWRLI